MGLYEKLLSGRFCEKIIWEHLCVRYRMNLYIRLLSGAPLPYALYPPPGVVFLENLTDWRYRMKYLQGPEIQNRWNHGRTITHFNKKGVSKQCLTP